MAFKVIIRTDSSQLIGSGHVMRCLTLATELRHLGANVEFITRPHFGNLDEYIKSKGFELYSLPETFDDNAQPLIGYESWLGVDQRTDAENVIEYLKETRPDWLIVDHYGLDDDWELLLKPYVENVMVIDDMANRHHFCDILLDQNYILDTDRYDCLINKNAIKLLGPYYSLLRSDFYRHKKSIGKEQSNIKRVFIFFGGSDLENLTSISIKALSGPTLKNLFLDVVVGKLNTNRSSIRSLVNERGNAKLHVQVENIPELMSMADVALGAGGTSTWERLAIGLPSFVISTAENQIAFTKDLNTSGYINWLGTSEEIGELEIKNSFLNALNNSDEIFKMSNKGQKLVNVYGTNLVAKMLINWPQSETLK